MSTFADVAAFAAQHAGCAGLVPRVHSPRDGGHMLAITCACGAVHERWVTADETRALPRSDAAAPAPTRLSPAPSPALLAALDDVLAEPARDAGPPPSVPFEGPSPPLPVAARPATMFRPPDRSRPTAPGPPLDAASHAAATARGSPGDTHITRPRRWLVLLTVVAACLGTAGAAMFWGSDLEWRRSAPPASGTSRAVAAPTASSPISPADEDRRTMDTALDALRELQTVSNAGHGLPAYRSRVETMQDRVRPFTAGSAPGALRQAVRDVVDVHTLAVEIWSARLEDRPEEWARLDGRDVLRACPQLARALESSARTPGRADEVRSRLPTSSLPQLWSCSADRLQRVDRLLAGR